MAHESGTRWEVKRRSHAVGYGPLRGNLNASSLAADCHARLGTRSSSTRHPAIAPERNTHSRGAEV
jgi:hypothetical protein